MKIIRDAQITLTAAELSKALGVPFETVKMVEWHTSPGEVHKGLKLILSIEEELKLPRLLSKKA